MRDGMRRRRLVLCCMDGIWWRGERSISALLPQRSRCVADYKIMHPRAALLHECVRLGCWAAAGPWFVASILQAASASLVATIRYNWP